MQFAQRSKQMTMAEAPQEGTPGVCEICSSKRVLMDILLIE